MKNTIVLPIKYALYLCALFLSLVSCDDGNLEIQQSYDFQLETMPVPKSIAEGETIELRCKLIVAGNYNEASYSIRYFQLDGKGSLRLGRDDVAFLPNDRYPLPDKEFRLYYTSESADQHTIDIYIEDNAGAVVMLTFSFTDEKVKE